MYMFLLLYHTPISLLYFDLTSSTKGYSFVMVKWNRHISRSQRHSDLFDALLHTLYLHVI